MSQTTVRFEKFPWHAVCIQHAEQANQVYRNASCQRTAQPPATRIARSHHCTRSGADAGRPAQARPARDGGAAGRTEVPRRVPVSARAVLAEWVLQPGTGKAIEVLAGQILRIEQIEGGQCVDFNAFNLHDYKEFMHCGRTRTVHGFNPTTGTFMWSAPPRKRAMFYILADPVRQNDVLFPRCSAYVYESTYGFQTHTNCHDIQAEAQREYGLTPDDVHDSFNFFMVTDVQ